MTIFLGEYNMFIVPSSTSHKGNPVIKTLIYRAKIRHKKLFTNDFLNQNVHMNKRARLPTFAISFVDNFCLL